jgi:hypothetical protein
MEQMLFARLSLIFAKAEMAKEDFWANLAHSRKDRTQVFSIRVGESPDAGMDEARPR